MKKIAELALRKQIVTESELKKLSREQTLHLVFHSGFSSSSKISDISGRGVGLASVVDAVSSLKGEIYSIKSELDKGTEFTFTISAN
ncbi:MAG: hypothetical protein HRU19_23000 [Pseudobacteriovorax sp.]|nr:hypothetical protein [Pseudobacteriovorax sp.]